MENVLEPMLNELNVSRVEVQQKLGDHWSQMIRMTVNFFGATSTVRLDNNIRLSYLGLMQLCYTLPLDTVPFSNELDHIQIFINSSIGAFAVDLSPHLIESDVGYLWDSYQSQFDSDLYKTTNNGIYISMVMSKQLNHTMGVYGQYIQLPRTNGIDRCTADLTEEICQAKCRIQQIEKLCNCSPTTWPMLMKQGSNNCTLAQYKTCLKLNLTGESFIKLVKFGGG
jgi:hypothetical protein